MRVTLYTDGGTCRSNPGEMAYGFVGVHPDSGDNKPLFEGCGMIGMSGTNNEAEYRAVIKGLQRAWELGFREIELRMDSELVYNQLLGNYQIKNEGLIPLHRKTKSWLKQFKKVQLRHVKRTSNRRADQLANMAINMFVYHRECEEERDGRQEA